MFNIFTDDAFSDIGDIEFCPRLTSRLIFRLTLRASAITKITSIKLYSLSQCMFITNPMDIDITCTV